MTEFNIMDMVIVGLILFLAIKGLVNGFSKELFNFLGLIGGVVVAARVHTTVGNKIAEQNILPNIPPEVQSFIGFILTLLVIWIIISFISSIVNGLNSGEPNFFSRILGYIISVAKYAVIFSLILYGLSQADLFKDNFADKYKDSKLFKPMGDVGAKILNVKATTAETTTEATTHQEKTSIPELKDHNSSN